MTIYLWHLMAPVIATLALVLPGLWPAPEVGTTSWWSWRLAWVALNAVLTVPVVLLLARFERPPQRVVLTTSSIRVAFGVALCLVGWATVAIVGLHVPAWPAALPWIQLVALVLAGAALVRQLRMRSTTPTGVPAEARTD